MTTRMQARGFSLLCRGVVGTIHHRCFRRRVTLADIMQDDNVCNQSQCRPTDRFERMLSV